jgi:hypothetical protein
LSRQVRHLAAEVAVTGTLPATARQQIQDTLDTYGGIRIAKTSTPQILDANIRLGSGNVLEGEDGAALQWSSSLGDNYAVGNKQRAPSSTADYDIRPTVKNIELIGPWDGSTLPPSSGGVYQQSQMAISWLACQSPRVENVLARNWIGDGLYHQPVVSNRALTVFDSVAKAFRVKTVFRNGCTFIGGNGFNIQMEAEGFGLHGFDAEGDDSSCIIENGEVHIVAKSGGGLAAIDPSGVGAGFTLSDKNSGTPRNITAVVRSTSITGHGAHIRGATGVQLDLTSRACTGNGLYMPDGGARVAHVTLQGYLDIPAGAGNAVVSRTVGNILNTTSLFIRQVNGNELLSLQALGGGCLAGLNGKFTGASHAEGVALYGCEGVQVMGAIMEQCSKSFYFGSSGLSGSTVYSSHCTVNGGRSISPTSKAVDEIAGCDYNRILFLDKIGASTVTLTGANSAEKT